MSGSKREGRKDYLVGYGRPPQATRFQKGQSGNVRGRPRKRQAEDDVAVPDSAADAILRKELDRKIRLTDRDGVHEMTSLEIVQRAQLKKAMEGSPIAQRDILREARALEKREAEREAAEEAAKREDFEKTVRWRDYRRSLWNEAAREGREPEKPWPHPDDILLNEDALTWQIRGPSSEKWVPFFRHIEAQRDLSFVEAELDARGCLGGALASLGIHELMWMIFDEQLPLRWQIGSRLDRVTLGLASTSTPGLRRLAKECKKEVEYWHRIDQPAGERIDLGPAIVKVIKPHVERLGYGSIREFEEHLERESGNPPLSSRRITKINHSL